MVARLISGLALYLALVDASIHDPSEPDPTNTVTIYHSTYATLDNIWPFLPTSTSTFYEKRFRKLPLGWSIAEDTPDAKIAIQMYNFATNSIVLRNKIVDHQLNVVEGKLLIDDNLGVKADITVPYRILIKNDTPARVQKMPFETINISNVITYHGRDYAVADNANPRDNATNKCDTRFYALTDGWTVAKEDFDTEHVMISTRFPFGYSCKFTSARSGQGHAVDRDDPDCQMGGMLAEATLDNQKLFAVKDRHTHDTQVKTCGAVMLSRPSTKPNTWSVEESITNMYKVAIDGQEHHFAVLDNTPADKPYYNSSCNGNEDCCQNVAKNVPLGWKIATKDMPGYTEAASQPWGTYCTGLTDKGEPCNYVLKYAQRPRAVAVRYCDSRVLIKRDSTTPVPVDPSRSIVTTSSSDPVTTTPPVVTVVTISSTTSPTRGVSGVIIPSMLAAFAAAGCALLL